MKCNNLRKKYFKYIDNQLSARKSRLLEEHIRSCPACAAEVESLEKVRSLLQAAGSIERPDTYWNTYWDRLEKKLPAKPSPIALRSRVYSALANMFRQPVILGRIAIYALLFAFLLYTMPYGLNKPASKPSAPMLEPPDMAKMESQEVRRFAETREMAPLKRLPGVEERYAALPKPKSSVSSQPAGPAVDKGKVSSRPMISETKGAFASAAPAVPLAADKAGLRYAEKKSDAEGETKDMLYRMEPAKPVPALAGSSGLTRSGLESAAVSKDEYTIAESHFKSGDYIQAIPAYQNFVKANPEDERALNARYQIGEAYYQLGNYSEALSNFATLAETEKPAAPAPTTLALQQQSESNAAAPERELAKETDAKTKRPETRLGVSAEQVPLKDAKKAREELMSQVLFRQAESYEHLGKRAEALAAYRRYVERYPQGKNLPQAKEKIAKLAR